MARSRGGRRRGGEGAMGEEGTPAAVSMPRCSTRLLGLLNQPGLGSESGPDRFLELDEGDVVWPSASDFSPPSPLSAASSLSPTPSPSPSAASAACYSSSGGRARRRFLPEKFGLSAALAEEEGSPTLQRVAGMPVAVPAAPRATEMARVPHQSAPVNVPVWPRNRRRGFDRLDEDEERGEEREEEDDYAEWVPPHVMVARSHVMTFSVFEGVGRTLKGRDLRKVRNAVWQKTGFLD